MSSFRTPSERALNYLRNVSRIKHHTPRDNPGARTTGRQIRSKDNKAGKSHKLLERAAKPPLGWIMGDFYGSYIDKFPAEEPYNNHSHLRREYPPLSLLELQRLIDLGWLDTTHPIDLSTLCNTHQYQCNPAIMQFGVQITDQGADIFATPVNLEVQAASELAIAAIERVGGRVTCAYYDPISLDAMANPLKFFKSGEPIPKRGFPPVDLMDRYTDPRKRGYLADPTEIEDARFELAQKYGYQLPNINKEDESMNMVKDALQIFFGLSPGSVVNLADKVVLHPTHPDLVEFYSK